MNPTGRFQDWSRRAAGLVELTIAAVGVGPEDAGVVGQMRLGMFAGPMARVIEHGRGWRRSVEWLVVAHIDPDATGIGLASGQDRDSGVVAVQPLGAQRLGLEAVKQRRQRRRAAANLVGPGRQATGTPLGIALRLPVERLMLTKLLEQHHRLQAWPRPACHSACNIDPLSRGIGVQNWL